MKTVEFKVCNCVLQGDKNFLYLPCRKVNVVQRDFMDYFRIQPAGTRLSDEELT